MISCVFLATLFVGSLGFEEFEENVSRAKMISCVTMVKQKSDASVPHYDAVSAEHELDPSKFKNKAVADMLEYCYDNLPFAEAKRIALIGEIYELESEMDIFLVFDIDKYRTPEADLESTEDQTNLI
jgi:hypothetical protein